MALREYAYFKRGEYIRKGTRQELADELGVSQQVISNHVQSTKLRGTANDIQVFPLYEDSPLVKTKVNTINNLIEKEGITQRILAEWICMKPKTLSSKLNKRISFTEDEVEKIEDVFMLKRGELLK